MANRILKTCEGITLTEATLSDGKHVIGRVYSVRTGFPTEQRTFGDLGSAEIYFEQLLLARSA
jgi:hypothetical protein